MTYIIYCNVVNPMKKHLVRFFKAFRTYFKIKLYLTFFAVMSMIGVTVLVYFTDGIQYAYAHIIYIPIVLMALIWGYKGGLITGLIAGLLLGPYMPVNVSANIFQTFPNWLFRLFIFMFIGALIGFLFDFFIDEAKKVSYLTTHHLESGLPNYTHYIENHYDIVERENNISMTLQINNYDNLIILLGLDIYSTVLKNIYKKLLEILPMDSHVIQMSSNRFWIDIDKDMYKTIRNDFTKNLETNTLWGIKIPLYIDFSIGISMPNKTQSLEDHIKQSDVAALHAKHHHVKHVVFHETHEQDRIYLDRLSALPQAIENEELFLVFHPIIDVETNKTVTIECLIRWRKNGEILNPDDFIPLAEETRVIDLITEWVLAKVLLYYPDFKTLNPEISIAINVSQRNLFNPNLIQNLRQKIMDSNIPYHKLEIEVTESTLMLNRQLTQSFLESFRSLGVKTILDDFGAGYSSLSCLRDLPIDSIKIDREFTRYIEEKDDIRVMVKAIIDLAHYMNLQVVAEGVETKITYELLKDLGCDLVQGFYFTKPLEYQGIVEWLRNNN